MAKVLMQLPHGIGGFEVGGRRYLPDARGAVFVEESDIGAAERHGARRPGIAAAADVEESNHEPEREPDPPAEHSDTEPESD